MPKLLRFSGREFRRLLERQGFICVRQRGSHMVMQKLNEESGTITVPVPNHKELKTGTLRGLIDQSQLPRSLFEADS